MGEGFLCFSRQLGLIVSHGAQHVLISGEWAEIAQAATVCDAARAEVGRRQQGVAARRGSADVGSAPHGAGRGASHGRRGEAAQPGRAGVSDPRVAVPAVCADCRWVHPGHVP